LKLIFGEGYSKLIAGLFKDEWQAFALS